MFRTISKYLWAYTSDLPNTLSGEQSRRHRDSTSCGFSNEQQLDAALRLKLATRRTATRKLIDAQENSGGGEDGSWARARQDAGAYFSRGFYTRFAVSWMLYHRSCHPSPSCPMGKGTRSRNATLHWNAGLTLSKPAIAQQVSNVRFKWRSK